MENDPATRADDQDVREESAEWQCVGRGDAAEASVAGASWHRRRPENCGEKLVARLPRADGRTKVTPANKRTYTSFMYQANSWVRPRKVVARLECSLQPDTGGEITSTGMRQEVDIRYVVTSLKGFAQHLYEDVYCQRGQMENLIKLHKAQLASDRMSCHSATANQVRLVLHTAAFWLMHGVRAAIPHTDPLAKAEFTTIRERLIKIGARVIEHIARIRIQLPTSCPEGALFRAVAFGLMPSAP
jgi:Transposase DDE domain group 1